MGSEGGGGGELNASQAAPCYTTPPPPLFFGAGWSDKQQLEVLKAAPETGRHMSAAAERRLRQLQWPRTDARVCQQGLEAAGKERVGGGKISYNRLCVGLPLNRRQTQMFSMMLILVLHMSLYRHPDESAKHITRSKQDSYSLLKYSIGWPAGANRPLLTCPHWLSGY